MTNDIKIIKAFLEELRYDVGYGGFHGGNPNNFTPDPDSKEEEIAAWKAAREKWNADQTPAPGFHQWLDLGDAVAHVSMAGFGLGTYRTPNPEAEAVYQAILRVETSVTRAIEACELIEQRDRAESWAGTLANGIAEMFGVEIGEHSNLNNPWEEAADVLSGNMKTVQALHAESADARKNLQGALDTIIAVSAKWEAEKARADSIPRHLLIALANAKRAFEAHDTSALATVNEHLQPLVDAALSWVANEVSAKEAEKARADLAERRLLDYGIGKREGWEWASDRFGPTWIGFGFEVTRAAHLCWFLWSSEHVKIGEYQSAADAMDAAEGRDNEQPPTPHYAEVSGSSRGIQPRAAVRRRARAEGAENP